MRQQKSAVSEMQASTQTSLHPHILAAASLINIEDEDA
jgi:hypothetical protein